MGHQRNVSSEDLWRRAALGAGGGTEPARGSARVRDLVQDDPEDASLCRFAGISAAVASEAPKPGGVARRHLRHAGSSVAFDFR